GWDEWLDLWRGLRGASRRRLWLVAAVSTWWWVWLIDQVGPGAGHRGPLGVPRAVLVWTGVDAPTPLDPVLAWLHDPAYRQVGAWLAWGAGLAWAAGNRRGPLPTVAGWAAVLLAAESLGYSSATGRAAGCFALVVAVLFLASLPLRRRPVDRRKRLLPGDVLRTGTRAAALVVLVPLALPILAVTGVCRPYLTVPPRPAREQRVPAPRSGADTPETAVPPVR
ncbi:MAG TPA: hypothetical protein VIL00_05405, partial [Pseudonocardiaceae bacterium]